MDHARLWRCSPLNGCTICCGIGSIAWLHLDGVFYRDVRRIIQAAGRKDFSVLKTRREKQEAAERPFDRADWATLTQARGISIIGPLDRKHSLTVSNGLR